MKIREMETSKLNNNNNKIYPTASNQTPMESYCLHDNVLNEIKIAIESPKWFSLGVHQLKGIDPCNLQTNRHSKVRTCNGHEPVNKNPIDYKEENIYTFEQTKDMQEKN